MKFFYESFARLCGRASEGQLLVATARRGQRSVGKILAVLAGTWLLGSGSPAMAQSAQVGTPNGGYVSFAVAANSTSSAIALPVGIPWHVTAGVTTNQNEGVAEFEAIASVENSAVILEWTGLNSPSAGGVTSGDSASGAATVAVIDFSGDVVLTTSRGSNSFWVSNNTGATQTGYITWTGFGTALTEPSNTALGNNALSTAVNSTGSVGTYNTATGYASLFSASSASSNTATGAFTLKSNVTGGANSAFGYAALYNTTGSENTGTGYAALYSNKGGTYNTATGYEALYSNSSGNYNSATGYESLYSNSSGSYNSAFGDEALLDNTTGQQNDASGVYALRDNTTGGYNTAAGVDALYKNTTGSTNIAVGYKAGFNLTTGSNNIDIGSPGAAAESGVIRIGTVTGTTSTQIATYIAGIYQVNTGGLPVVIDSQGQLGTTTSSARFKTAITPLGSESAKLQELRPVSFRYKADPRGERRYGLIAEEVAQVYPELVVRNEQGRIDGVRYDELAPLLLNEVQQQQRQMATQAGTIAAQNERLASQEAQMRDLKHQQQELTSRLEELQNLQTQMAAMRAALLKGAGQ